MSDYSLQRNEPLVDEFQVRVNLGDTDAAGVIFMISPSTWAQVGFENLMRSAGLPLEALLPRDHHYPVVNFSIEHHAPLTLGTLLTIRTGVVQVGRRSVKIVTTVNNAETGVLSATATRIVVAKSRTGQPVSAEDLFREVQCGEAALGLESQQASDSKLDEEKKGAVA